LYFVGVPKKPGCGEQPDSSFVGIQVSVLVGCAYPSASHRDDKTARTPELFQKKVIKEHSLFRFGMTTPPSSGCLSFLRQVDKTARTPELFQKKVIKERSLFRFGTTTHPS